MYSKWIYSILFCSFLTHSLFANDLPQSRTLPSAWMCKTPKKEESGAVFITASFLLWQTKVGGLEYATKNTAILNPTPTSTNFDATIITPDFAWKPGFKFQLGYLLPYDGWDTNLLYTFYRGTLTDIKRKGLSNLTPTGFGIVPLQFITLFSGLTSSPLFSFSTDKWVINFHTLDSELGRNFFINKSLKVRLLGGLKAAWIYQDYDVEYRNGNTVDNLQFNRSKITNLCRMTGVGPRAGFSSKWNLLENWNLIADGSFSTLYSYFNFRKKQDNNITNTANSQSLQTVYKLREQFSKISPIVQFKFGTDWGICIGTKNPYYLELTLGYEFQYWWGQNQMRKPISNDYLGEAYNNRSDLQMQGLTLTVELGF